VSDNKLERLFRAHANIKARLAVEARASKERCDPMKASLVVVETAMLQMLNDVGTDQLKVTGLGIVMPMEKIMPNCKDWEALYTYVTESGNFDLIARRLSSKHVKEYMDANGDTLPPGVAVHIERGVSVRRAPGAKT